MEPFTYEVLRDTYFHICRDMATELRKICISTVIRDAQDFATAIIQQLKAGRKTCEFTCRECLSQRTSVAIGRNDCVRTGKRGAMSCVPAREG